MGDLVKFSNLYLMFLVKGIEACFCGKGGILLVSSE